MEKVPTHPPPPPPPPHLLNEQEIVFYYFSLTLEASFIILEATFQMPYIRIYTFFYMQHFYKHHQAAIGRKPSKSQATP